MKKVFFSLLLVLCAVQMSAQIPVTDVASNTTQITNQIINGTTFTGQLVEMKQQASILTTTLKYVQEVSSAVRDVAYAKSLIERQFRIVDNCTRLIERSNKVDANLALQVERQVSAFLATNSQLIDLITNTLTTRFKMADSERVAMLSQINKEQKDLMKEIHTVDRILSTSIATNNIIEYQLFR